MLFAMVRRDPLVERIADAQRLARARAEGLRALVPALARELKPRGATRVRLFGSLATSAEPHGGTDVDLCVEGLDDAAIADATLCVETLASARVDVVRWESASERLRRRVDRDGVEVGIDAA
jgi:predicted nucleotidyltransferase